MANLGYPIIDGDGHVQEHDNEIVEYFDDPKLQGKIYGGNFPFFPTLDGISRDALVARWDKHPGYVGSTEWLNFLDKRDVECTVLYPTAGLSIGMVQDPDWSVSLCRAYNNWLSEKYMKVSKRLIGVALLPLQNPAEAVKELRRCVEDLGMVAGMLPANSADMGIRKHLGDDSFWPVYAEAERLNVPLAVHGAPSLGLGLNCLPNVGQLLLEHPVAQMIQMTGMMLSGMFDRFPKLKVGYLEADTGWVPYMMDRLAVFGSPIFGITDPRDIITSGRIYMSCQSGEVGLRTAMDRISSDVVIYASDFWHEPIAEIDEDVDILTGRLDLTDEEKRKIFRDNTIRFYSLDIPLAV
jgi:predicted TIM-barrel fold metal-dependent hydrolase